MPFKKRIGQDGHTVLARLSLAGGEGPSRSCADPHHPEKVVGNFPNFKLFRLVYAGEVEVGVSHGRGPRERLRSGLPVEVILKTGRHAISKKAFQLRILLPQHHQPVGLAERQRAEHKSVECAEHRGIRAYTEGQRQNRHRRKPGGFEECPHRVANVSHQVLRFRDSQTLPVHSYRSATMGSTLVARRAGINPASSATAASTRTAMTIESGSVAFSPNNMADKK